MRAASCGMLEPVRSGVFWRVLVVGEAKVQAAGVDKFDDRSISAAAHDCASGNNDAILLEQFPQGLQV